MTLDSIIYAKGNFMKMINARNEDTKIPES